jgi:hypothetical protein
MPAQETFFEQEAAGRRVEVLKTHDQTYAREVFSSMDEEAQRRLWAVLRPEEIYDPGGLPTLGDPTDVNGEAEAFLWDELLEQAREDGTLLSFFVVNESAGGRSESLYVSPDWPSAEAFAKARLILR